MVSQIHPEAQLSIEGQREQSFVCLTETNLIWHSLGKRSETGVLREAACRNRWPSGDSTFPETTDPPALQPPRQVLLETAGARYLPWFGQQQAGWPLGVHPVLPASLAGRTTSRILTPWFKSTATTIRKSHAVCLYFVATEKTKEVGNSQAGG